MTLTDFLLQRIAEDEALAWKVATIEAGMIETFSDRWLAECQAKRQILDAHPARTPVATYPPDLPDYCGTCDDMTQDYPCVTIRALASVYSDHVDYQQHWAPDA